MKTGVKVSARVRFEPRRKGTRCLVRTPETVATAGPCGRLPRITRLMALAIHFDGLIRSGAVANYAELARLGNVTRARIVIGRFKTSHSWALQNQQGCECSVSGLKLVFRTCGIAASQCFNWVLSAL